MRASTISESFSTLSQTLSKKFMLRNFFWKKRMNESLTPPMDARQRYNITFLHVHITLHPPFLQTCLRVTTSLLFPLGLVHIAQFTTITIPTLVPCPLPKRANKFHLKHQEPKLEAASIFKEEFHGCVLVHREVADVYHRCGRIKWPLEMQVPVIAQVLCEV